MKRIARKKSEQQCPLIDQCELTNKHQAKTPELIHRIQTRYCTKTNHNQCARFRVYQALGIDAVPPLMLPEQTDWVRQIIEDSKCDCPAQ
jgi:hypothetical protein